MAQVTSSSLNLATSLVSAVGPGGSLARLGIETYNWLQRERIDERSFNRCMELATGLGLPNENGNIIQKQLENSTITLEAKIARAPITLRRAGSLGRALAGDIETSYMVTTVAVLANYHDTISITSALTNFILTSSSQTENNKYHSVAQRAPIRAVVSKIVESIFLNVVNSGHGVSLPQELAHLCPHVVCSQDFAEIIRLANACTDDLMIVRSTRFVPDVTLWLLNHFHGTILVTVGNDILLERKLGTSKTKIHVMVERDCNERTTGHDGYTGDIELQVSLKAVEARATTLFRAKLVSRDQYAYQSITRQPLYGFSHSWESKLDREDCNLILGVAKRILAWLLEIHVPCSQRISRLPFRIELDFSQNGEADSSSRRPLRLLLPKYPGLMHQYSSGHSITPATVKAQHVDGDGNKKRRGTRTMSLTWLVQYFPVIEDMTDKIGKRCPCKQCERGEEIVQCRAGCLRHIAIVRLYILLAHALCDASGVQNVAGSNITDEDAPCAKAAARVLLEIASEQNIYWPSWFYMIGVTAAGFLADDIVYTLENNAGGNRGSPLALQYGSYTIAYAALDITKPFGLSSTLGVVAFDAAIDGVPDDIGIVFAEDGTAFDEAYHSGLQLETPVTNATLSEDTVEITVQCAIFRTGDYIYHQMTMVRAQNHICILDPVAVVNSLLKSVMPTCQHMGEPGNEQLSPCQIVDFDQTLARWYVEQAKQYREKQLLFGRHKIMMTNILHTVLKFHVLLGRTTAGAVIRQLDQCCLDCACKARLAMSTSELVPIINVSAELLDSAHKPLPTLRLADSNPAEPLELGKP